MAANESAECILKIEVTGTDDHYVCKAMRFPADDTIMSHLNSIYERFSDVGVALASASDYSLFYEPFSPQNTLLLEFVDQQRQQQAGEKKLEGSILTSQSLWRQMADAHQGAGGPPTLARGRSASIDLAELRGGGANTNRQQNGFWLDTTKSFAYYDFIPGTQLCYRARSKELPDTATALESKKNFIRVHDKRGSYKTLFVSENITTSDLLVELAAKFNVSSTASFGLFMKRNDTNQVIRLKEDAKPLQLLAKMQRTEVDLVTFIYKKAPVQVSTAPKSAAAATTTAASTTASSTSSSGENGGGGSSTSATSKSSSSSSSSSSSRKKQEVDAAILTRIALARRKGVLDLSFQRLRVFPTQFFELTNLKTLTLNSAGLSELPDFSALVSLAELRLVKNKFTVVPPQIFGVTSLVELDMGNNMIQVLPDELANMPHLRELYLYVNYIREIPQSFTSLTTLNVLNLAHNKLSSLPGCVLPRLKQLSQLKVSGNQLESIPPEIGALEQLSDLNASRNKLRELPSEIGHLAQLRWLNLKENVLTGLPNELCQLGQLEELLVSNNELETLPASFPFVRLLLANNNKITHLPDTMCLDSVIELSLSENRMRQLPASFNSMRNLQKLSITTNQLEMLPENISDLRKLTQLDIKNNCLRQLPDSVGNLKLCVLDVGHNQLESLPDTIWNSNRIWYVHCAGNPLKSVPPVNPTNPPYMADLFLGRCELQDHVLDDIQAIRTMRTLDLGYNRLTEIRPSVQKMQNLQILFLCGNELTALPDELTRLKFLRELHLANNRLSTLPASLPKLRSLRTLDLSHNELTDVSVVLSLEALEWLDISNNCSLRFAPDNLCMLKSLQEFYADNVVITGDPADLPYELSHGSKERGSRFAVSWADMMGRRDGMEDCTVFRGSLGPAGDMELYCVLDGHGGRRVATSAGSDLLVEIPRRIAAQPDTSAADILRQTFRDIHQRIGEAEIGVMEGATAVAVLILGSRLLVANVGDTRAVLSRNGVALRLSYDHKPDLPEEEERIRALGGFVGDDQRVNAVLAVSRAFGDFALDPFVLCDPYISDTVLTPEDQFLIIACDGVWDVLSDQQAVDVVRGCARQKAATVLRDYAYMYGSMDNISCVVVHLQQS